MVMRLKGCPRCKGDVLLDRDEYGWYEQCMQCGYLCDVKNIAEAPKERTKTQNKGVTKPFKFGQ